MFRELTQIPEVWQKAWSNKAFKRHLVLSVLAFAAASFYNFHCLREWQSRPGMQLDDLVSRYLHPYDFSAAIFMLEYSTLAVVLIFIMAHPDRLVKGLQALALVMLARTMAIYFVPLEPPRDMIFLQDPVAAFFLHTPDVAITKDLFFSGHISIITILFLCSANKYVKWYAFICTVAVAILIVWQHVHYTMDVLAAPIVSYSCYRMVDWMHTQSKYGVELQDV